MSADHRTFGTPFGGCECPACGEMCTDLWEVVGFHDEDVTEMTCGSCGVDLRYVTHVSHELTCQVADDEEDGQ